ncbi:MAG: vWA domain-containing protein, partial [Gemmatimonadota bacterium]
TSPVLVGIVPVAAPAPAPSSNGSTTELSAGPAPVDHPPEPPRLEPSGDVEDSETIDLHLTLKQAEPGPIGPGLQVHVRVENQVGRPIENLGSGSFLLRRRAGESRLLHPDDVAVVDSEPDGRAIFLVMDVSRSMVGEDRFPVACDLARGVVAQLGEGDRAALVRCADTAELVLPLGGPADVAVALADLQVGGRTALWDGIGLAVATARGVPNAVVIVVTDGGDTISSRSLDEVLREAVEAEVRVIVVGTGLRPSERAGLGRLASETNPMDIGGASFMEQAGIEELARLIAGIPSVGLPWYRLTWSALALESGVEAPTLIVRYRVASGIREDAIPLQ